MKKMTKDKKSIKSSDIIYYIRKFEIQEQSNRNIITFFYLFRNVS